MPAWAPWRRVLWTAGAAATVALFAFAAVCAISAVEMQRRTKRLLAEPPLQLAVDLCRSGTYGAEWRVPYYGEHGTEFTLVVTPAFSDAAALLQGLSGFRGTVSFSEVDHDVRRVAVGASGFRVFSQDIVRHNMAPGAFLIVPQLQADGAGRLEFAVEQPAPGLTGHAQMLEARPVMCPLVALWPLYISWGLAAVTFPVAALMSFVLVRAKVRERRGRGLTASE